MLLQVKETLIYGGVVKIGNYSLGVEIPRKKGV